MIEILLSLGLAYVVGYFVVRAFTPFSNHAITWMLAPGLGIGLTSLSLFLTLLIANQANSIYLPIFDSILLLIAITLFMRFRSPALDIIKLQGSPTRLIRLLFYCGVTLATALYLTLAVTNPHGNWDAWVIWNLRARFLIRFNENWMHSFTADVVTVHSDYPLMISTSVARLWVYSDTESTFAPMLIAAIFSFATVGLLYLSVKMFRGTEAAMVAVLVLIVSPRFVLVGVAQYADIPLSYFILTALLLTYLRPYFPDYQNTLLVLASISAGLAAWTKNEGILFLGAFVGARLLMTLRWGRIDALKNEILLIAVGIAPMLLVIGYFKLEIAPDNYLTEGRGTTPFDRMIDIQRYITIAGFYLTQMAWFLLFGLPLMLRYLLKDTKQTFKQKTNFELWTGVLILTIQFLGYIGIYIITPADLYWQLGASLPRLLLHLWPGFLLTISLLIFPSSKKLTTYQPTTTIAV